MMRVLLVMLMMTGALAAPALAQTYALGPVVVGSGGDTQTGGLYVLSATIGESVVGLAAESGTPRIVSYGFWTPDRTLVGVEQQPATAPFASSLRAPAPNPFRGRTTICYDVATNTAGPVRLLVFDVRGALVRTLVSSAMAPGRYTTTWDGRGEGDQSARSGIFFLRLQAGQFNQTRKVVLLP
jgi:hypothetical protein